MTPSRWTIIFLFICGIISKEAHAAASWQSPLGVIESEVQKTVKARYTLSQVELKKVLAEIQPALSYVKKSTTGKTPERNILREGLKKLFPGQEGKMDDQFTSVLDFALDTKPTTLKADSPTDYGLILSFTLLNVRALSADLCTVDARKTQYAAIQFKDKNGAYPSSLKEFVDGPNLLKISPDQSPFAKLEGYCKKLSYKKTGHSFSIFATPKNLPKECQISGDSIKISQTKLCPISPPLLLITQPSFVALEDLLFADECLNQVQDFVSALHSFREDFNHLPLKQAHLKKAPNGKVYLPQLLPFDPCASLVYTNRDGNKNATITATPKGSLKNKCLYTVDTANGDGISSQGCLE